VISRRGPFTINLAKKDSREEGPHLLPMLLGSLVSRAEALEVSLVEAHFREDRLLSLHQAPGAGLVEAVSTQRTPKRSLSE